jgi:formylglycine-generating enzyme required for sulfatase activity/protocatechuate 3,4-dioxygenase beta subunit
MFIPGSLRSAVIVATASMLTAGGVWATENKRDESKPQSGTGKANESNVTIAEDSTVSQAPGLGNNRRVKPIDSGDGVSMRFVLISAGEFMMGSPVGESGRRNNEGPQHKVKLTKPFYMLTTEVTQQQYIQIMGSNPSIFKGANNPVEKVSWNDAIEFCRKLSTKTGRKITLPTEAQWEYACRAGTDTRFSFGDDDMLLESYCWYKSNSIKRSRPVATKKPNAWGLYNMHGNVMEWCNDRFGHNYYSISPEVDPKGPSNGQPVFRVYRGGCCIYVSDFCRSATRSGSFQFSRNGATGFRVIFAGEVDSSKKVIDIVIAKEADKIIIPPEEIPKMQSAGGFIITGVVQNEAGMPVDGAEIKILPDEIRDLRLYAEGKFEINWQPRKSKENQSCYYLAVRHKQKNLATVVEINKDTDTLDVILRPGGTLTGKVVDSAGKGIEKAMVLTKLKGSNGMEVHTGFFGRTDAEGKFEIRALPLGHKYSVNARAMGFRMNRIEVHSDDARNNRIDAGPIILARGKFTVSGVVVDLNDQPVDNAHVYCYGEGQPGSNARTDVDGRFTLDGIFKGSIHITAYIKGDSARDVSYGSIHTGAGATFVKIVLRYSHTYGPR